jgi:DNA-binding GntR family transcriptional regulator
MTIASDDRGRQAVQEMNHILDAIRARDAHSARDAATSHVARVADIAARMLTQLAEEVLP